MSTATLRGSMAQELARICGSENVIDDPAALEEFSIDEVVPAAAISPASAQEIAAVLRLACEKDLVVVPAGGFTAQSVGAVPERIDVLLRTDRLDEIEFHDPGDLTVGVGAGCISARLNEHLGMHRQFLPLDVARAEAATIGGILARSAHGPLRHGCGGVRDFCIGITFVTRDGKIAKGGGRVVKNVTGYDLMKLLIGSHGTLGVITSANFKVFPLPRQTRSFLMEFASLDEALIGRDRIVRSALTPLCLEVLNPRAQEYLREPIAPRDPDHYAPQQPVSSSSGTWQLALRASGSDAVLARYRKELGSAMSREIDGDEEAEFWRAISNLVPAAASRHKNVMAATLNATSASAVQALKAVERAGLDNNLLPAIVGRAAVASFEIAFVPLSVDPPSAMQYATAISALRAQLPPECSAVVTRCPTEAKRHFDVWGPSPTYMASMRAVKRALDPKNILNRGRFLVS